MSIFSEAVFFVFYLGIFLFLFSNLRVYTYFKCNKRVAKTRQKTNIYLQSLLQNLKKFSEGAWNFSDHINIAVK